MMAGKKLPADAGRERALPKGFDRVPLLDPCGRLARSQRVSADEARKMHQMAVGGPDAEAKSTNRVVSLVMLEPTPGDAVLGCGRNRVAVPGFREDALEYYAERVE
jgi:hypothetical protein